MLKLTIVLMFVCVNAETTRISIDVDGGKINQDVNINRLRNTVTVSVGRVSHLPAQSNYRSSINLHDYTRKIVALKDIDAGECTIIEHINETLSAVEKLLLAIKVFNYQHKLVDMKAFTKIPMTEENMSKIFGNDIAEFCNGYHMFKGMPDAGKERRTSTKNSGHRNPHKKCVFSCLVCSFQIEEPSAEQVLAEVSGQSNKLVAPAVVG